MSRLQGYRRPYYRREGAGRNKLTGRHVELIDSLEAGAVALGCNRLGPSGAAMHIYERSKGGLGSKGGLDTGAA